MDKVCHFLGSLLVVWQPTATPRLKEITAPSQEIVPLLSFHRSKWFQLLRETNIYISYLNNMMLRFFFPPGVLTRRHRFGLLLLLGLISDPDKDLKSGKFWAYLFLSLRWHCSESVQSTQSKSSFTCSQVSRIMTSSVARSSWVISPGTSSIWEEQRGLVEL